MRRPLKVGVRLPEVERMVTWPEARNMPIHAIGVNSFVVNVPLKSAVRRKTPNSEVPAERSLVKPESYSFPSGHTASAAAVSGIVGRPYLKLWVPINGVAVMVGFSRVYTGVHYTGDILGGWIVGRGVAFAVWRVAPASARSYVTQRVPPCLDRRGNYRRSACSRDT